VRSRLGSILFTLLAPITVPASILFLAGANLLGGAFYIVIEASLARILRRPITLSRNQMILLAVPVLIAAPIALGVLLLLWFIRHLGLALCRLGNWQTGTTRRGWSFVVGLIWALAMLWTTLTCLNAAGGLALIGQPIEGRDLFVEFLTRSRAMKDMPPEMQQRRRTLIADLQAHQKAVHPQWDQLLDLLQDDNTVLSPLYDQTLMRRLADVPWFFVPGELSEDGADHSVLLLGPLFFVWLLLVRWPGTFAVLRPPVLRQAWFFIRTGVAAGAIYALVTWVPRTAYVHFYFPGDSLPALFAARCPAVWFGFDVTRWIRPEWELFNAGLWLALVGLLVFIFWLGWRISPFLGWPRYYVAFLASRLLQRKRIAFFSVGAVTLCVAMMIIVISVMGGFADSIRNRAHGLLGDLVMDGGLSGFPYYDEFIDELHRLARERLLFETTVQLPAAPPNGSVPADLRRAFAEQKISLGARATLRWLPSGGVWRVSDKDRAYILRPDEDRLVVHEAVVVQATPLIHSYGILQFPRTKKTKPVRIWGIRLDEYVRVNEFGKDLFYDNRFGGTKLGLQREPVYGFDERGIAALPGDRDRHYSEDYLPGLSPDQRAAEDKQYRRERGEPYPGPGVFELAASEALKPDYEGKEFAGVIVGRDIISRRLASGEYRRTEEYPCGEQCCLTMLPLTRGGDLSQEPPPKPSFRYVDDSRTGIYDIDSMNVYVDFDILQKLLSMEVQMRGEGMELGVFALDQSLAADLNAGPVSLRLRAAFFEHGLPLGPDPSISAEPDGKGWRIADGPRVFLVKQQREGEAPAEPDSGFEVLAATTSPRCSQIQIKLHPEFGADRRTLAQGKRLVMEVWDDLRVRVPTDPIEHLQMRQVDVQTWEEMQHDYISAIEKEKFLVLIMFGVISVVAVFLILCIFYMIVHEKTRDIGIIKSVGGSAEGVTAVFLAYGGAIGLVGCVLGALVGIAFVEHINEVQDFLARMNPAWRVWSPETYSFDKIPDQWKWSEVIWISVLAILASVAGAAIPALRAGRTWPVESLRYE
jgi:hypothetical protein